MHTVASPMQMLNALAALPETNSPKDASYASGASPFNALMAALVENDDQSETGTTPVNATADDTTGNPATAITQSRHSPFNALLTLAENFDLNEADAAQTPAVINTLPANGTQAIVGDGLARSPLESLLTTLSRFQSQQTTVTSSPTAAPSTDTPADDTQTSAPAPTRSQLAALRVALLKIQAQSQATNAAPTPTPDTAADTSSDAVKDNAQIPEAAPTHSPLEALLAFVSQIEAQDQPTETTSACEPSADTTGNNTEPTEAMSAHSPLEALLALVSQIEAQTQPSGTAPDSAIDPAPTTNADVTTLDLQSSTKEPLAHSPLETFLAILSQIPMESPVAGATSAATDISPFLITSQPQFSSVSSSSTSQITQSPPQTSHADFGASRKQSEGHDSSQTDRVKSSTTPSGAIAASADKNLVAAGNAETNSLTPLPVPTNAAEQSPASSATPDPNTTTPTTDKVERKAETRASSSRDAAHTDHATAASATTDNTGAADAAANTLLTATFMGTPPPLGTPNISANANTGAVVSDAAANNGMPVVQPAPLGSLPPPATPSDDNTDGMPAATADTNLAQPQPQNPLTNGAQIANRGQTPPRPMRGTPIKFSDAASPLTSDDISTSLPGTIPAATGGAHHGANAAKPEATANIDSSNTNPTTPSEPKAQASNDAAALQPPRAKEQSSPAAGANPSSIATQATSANLSLAPVQQSSTNTAQAPSFDISLQSASATANSNAAADTPVRLQFSAPGTLPDTTAMDALALKIAAKSASGNSHFMIRLDPPELGRIEVSLSVDAKGSAQASLSADKPQTLDLLQRDSSTLERSLKDAGLNLAGGMSFSLKSDTRSGGWRDPQTGGRSRALSISAVGASDAPGINAAIRFATSGANARLDITV